jgi:predicted component of type VI protein secretion system
MGPREPGSKPLDRMAGMDLEARDSSPPQRDGDLADDGTRRQDARKALRQVKRERAKGASHFVNVNLDRETKRRLKLAAFNTETSMQTIMERAIRSYLDDHGL